jgi:hypothetical protein
VIVSLAAGCGDVEETIPTAFYGILRCAPHTHAEQKRIIMTASTRLTAQGLRDLNYYGPKKVKPVVEKEAEPATEPAAPAVEAPVEPAPAVEAAL